MNWSSPLKAAAVAGAAVLLAPSQAKAYDIFPSVIEGFLDYAPWIADTIVDGQAAFDDMRTIDAKTGTNALLVPDLDAGADGSVIGVVDVILSADPKGLPISDEVPVVGRSRTKVSEKGLVLPSKAIVNERAFSASLAFAGGKPDGTDGNAFAVKFAGKAKESIKPAGTTGSPDLTAKVSATVGSLHKGKSVAVVKVVLDPGDGNGIDVARGRFFGDDPVASSKTGSYQADAYFLSDFAVSKGLSDGSRMSLSMTARRVDLPFPKILPGQFGKFSISAADGAYKFAGKGYHLKTADQIQTAGFDLEELIGGAGYLGVKFSGPAGSHSKSLGIGGALP